MNNVIDHSILSIYIEFVSNHIKHEKISITDHSIIVQYCIIKKEIEVDDYTIRIGSRWEFITMNYISHIMVLRYPKNYSCEYYLYIQLIT